MIRSTGILPLSGRYQSLQLGAWRRGSPIIWGTLTWSEASSQAGVGELVQGGSRCSWNATILTVLNFNRLSWMNVYLLHALRRISRELKWLFLFCYFQLHAYFTGAQIHGTSSFYHFVSLPNLINLRIHLTEIWIPLAGNAVILFLSNTYLVSFQMDWSF